MSPVFDLKYNTAEALVKVPVPVGASADIMYTLYSLIPPALGVILTVWSEAPNAHISVSVVI